MGFCSIECSVVGLILHMQITNSQSTGSRRGDIDLWGGAFRIALFWLEGVLIADRVMVPGDLSLIWWTRDALKDEQAAIGDLVLY